MHRVVTQLCLIFLDVLSQFIALQHIIYINPKRPGLFGQLDFCDHSMILGEMAGDLLTDGLPQPPPGAFRVKGP